MADKRLILSFPEDLYARLEQRAQQTQRSVEEEALDTLAAALPPDDGLPDDLEGELASLSLLDDEALWQAARSRLSNDDVARSEILHWKWQREGLTEAEAEATADLTRVYDRLMLVRAQAAVLLKQRGHDISTLLTSA
jgi:plasmid stability protein